MYTEVLILVACGGPDNGLPPGDKAPAATTTGDTSETGPSGSTGDTALPIDTGPFPELACVGFPAGSCVHLTGEDFGDYVGRHIDVADMDGDGLAEVMVPEPAAMNDLIATSAVHVLSAPDTSGPLRERAQVVFEGPTEDHPYWGFPATLIPGAGQVAMTDMQVAEEHIKVYDLPATSEFVPYGQHVGAIQIPSPYTQFGIPNHMAGCATAAGPALCVTSTSSDTEVGGNYAGQVLVYPAPIVGSVFVLDAAARYMGDPLDSARLVEGDGDFNADGVADLVVGAFGALGVGRVAVLVDPPDGEHRLWDVADATLTGTTAGAELGLGLATGDLDDDGYGDILAGAPFALTGQAFVARGPHSGDRSVASAEWTVTADDGRFLGYDLAVGDFDGDDVPDLAVGAPWPDGASEPGNVFVYLSPPPGAYAPVDATIALQSGVGVPDLFGIALDVGDLDGDGRDDLVVGAPRDPTVGLYAGSATILYGAGL